jgi:hypothetical protein
LILSDSAAADPDSADEPMDPEQFQEQARQVARAAGNLAHAFADVLRLVADRLGAAATTPAGRFRLLLDTEEGKALMQALAGTPPPAGDGHSPASPPPDAT